METIWLRRISIAICIIAALVLLFTINGMLQFSLPTAIVFFVSAVWITAFAFVLCEIAENLKKKGPQTEPKKSRP